MTDQYFTKNPNVASDRKTWSYTLNDRQYKFTTDNGVFSKNEVDFGSKTMIEAFIPPEINGPILDLGCGYGPVGIAVAKENEDYEVLGVDVNLRAVELANENARQNGAGNVTFIESDKFEKLDGKKFAAILTNPPIRAGKKVVHEMLEESQQALLEGGELWVVIQKKQGAPSAQKKLDELFSAVEVVAKQKGYFIFKAK
ncbi:class I SAM-dependent methyltransferase [Gracilibacillus oryzae]|uniref:Class I SAM-dependent methyltransferase n=1 Tax=Gracilibacillus oryzae TaxID=1672701 RepID=A0A7C8KNG5_9BACI|nr:class I SAM-dependent methyltransferase [Gracilibacillus oryzae]KAB8127762.1 class I SAM-dependent methyltransferase [Gracilibacillus oryzae]